MARSPLLSSLFGDPPTFDPTDDPLDMAYVDRFAPLVETLGSYFRPTYHGLENIPREGGALLVGNHGLLGFDGFFLFLAIYRACGRLPRGLADDVLFLLPAVSRFWQKMGAIHGTPSNALRSLQAGQLLNVYPGGARDSLKSRDRLYELHWEKSFGFIRVALQAGVPLILHMGIGLDDTFRVLGKLDLTGRILGHSKYALPLWLGLGPLPRPVKFTYYISPPIELEGTPADVDNRELIERNHRRVWDIANEMLRAGLERRKSIWLG